MILFVGITQNSHSSYNLKHYKTDRNSTALVPRNSFEKVVVEMVLSDNNKDIVHDDKRVLTITRQKINTKTKQRHNETNRYNSFQNNRKKTNTRLQRTKREKKSLVSD